MTSDYQQKQKRFVGALTSALELLSDEKKESELVPDARGYEVETFPSLLDRCRECVASAAGFDDVCVRTTHHFACTGGSLITKCLAVQPNVQLLSEVDPLSQLDCPGDANLFRPTDLIRLYSLGVRGTAQSTIEEIFRASVSVMLDDCHRRGLRLVLRDHSHGQFCVGDRFAGRKTVRGMLECDFPVLGIVTVRHPLDSYLAVRSNGWHRHFDPSTLDEYAIRYHRFLDEYINLPWFRYEDFVREPEETLSKMCSALRLPFDPGFSDLFDVADVSGNSGRQGRKIRSRPRRPVPEDVQKEVDSSKEYRELVARLGFSDTSDLLRAE